MESESELLTFLYSIKESTMWLDQPIRSQEFLESLGKILSHIKTGWSVCKRWKSFCFPVNTELEAASITPSDLVIKKRTSIKCNRKQRKNLNKQIANASCASQIVTKVT